jgi:phenylalanyl-tRNA synthetase beta chain
LTGLLKAVQRNLYRQVRSVAIFEVGTVFRMVDGTPLERPKAAFAMTGVADAGWTGGGRVYDVFDTKGALEAVMAELGVEWSLGEPHGRPLHPGRSAIVLVEGAPAGVIGELHPKVADALDIPGRVAVAELELEPLIRAAAGTVFATDVPRFPPVRRDLSFMMDERVSAGRVQAALEESAGELLGSCLLFDVHVGSPLPQGKKSLAFSVDLRAAGRTLDSGEADATVDAIVARLAAEFGAEIRSA